jgi:hypothetical protein
VRTKFDIHMFIVVTIMTSVLSINHVNKMMYRCMVRLPQGKEEMIDRLDNLCLVVDR